MSWLTRLNRPMVYASVGILIFCFAFLQTLSLGEPPYTLSIGEYNVGNYPTGLALHQPATGHFYATSIYDDYLVINGQRQTFSSLQMSVKKPSSRLTTLGMLALAQWQALPEVNHQFNLPKTISVESVVATDNSTSAHLDRIWKTSDFPAISAGAMTFKYSDADLLIDPKKKILFTTANRSLDQQLVEQQANTTFTSRGTLVDPTASWQLDSDSIVLINPDSSSVLQLQAVGEQKIFVHPLTKTVEFVTTLSSESEKTQKLLIKTWPTIADYPWNSPS